MNSWSAEERSYVWLDSFPIHDGLKRKLLKAAGSPVALVKNLEKFRDSLIESGEEGVYNNMLASLSDGGAYFARVKESFEKEGVTPLPYGSARYPKAWTNISDAPIVLYAKGNLGLLDTKLFCVVGSRRTSPAALKLGEKICEELTTNFTLLTGVADGADSAAIEGGLKSGKIVCLLAGGLGSVPKSNLPLLRTVVEKGLLLAPNARDVGARAFSYERRNKLLAALAEGVLVISAGEKSGALITAKYAEKFSKKLFAFPYPPASSNGCGCNELIKRGAKLTENAGDVFESFGFEAKSAPNVELTETEEKAIAYLREVGEAHISEIAERAGVPIFKATALLSALETKGLAVKLGGNRYSAV